VTNPGAEDGSISVTRWRKSSHSSNAASCVEIANADTTFGIRDSKNVVGGSLVLAATAFSAFVRYVRRG